jgi:CBS domain-containing protein
VTDSNDIKTPFEDPLENYDNPTFGDPVERALHNEPIASIQAQPMTCVEADTSVRETMKLMVGQQIACVLIKDNGRLVGVFSDRDVLDKVSLEYDQVIDGPVQNVMSDHPVYVHEDDCAAKVLSVMAVSGYRHVPVVNAKHEPIGIVSPQRLAKFISAHLKNECM